MYPFALGKTLSPEDRTHLFEVHTFCDLFVGKRKSPSRPKAMDAINRMAEHSGQLLTPACETADGPGARASDSLSCKFSS